MVERSEQGSPAQSPQPLLQLYLSARGIPSARLESAAGISRRQMARWRRVTSDIRLRNMIRILRALRLITGEAVQMNEIFDLDPEHWTV